MCGLRRRGKNEARRVRVSGRIPAIIYGAFQEPRSISLNPKDILQIIRSKTGHNSIFDLDVHVIPAAKGEPEHRHFDVRYIARTVSPGAVVIDRAESNDVAWVPLERAEALMNEAGSSRVIQKIRSRL